MAASSSGHQGAPGAGLLRHAPGAPARFGARPKEKIRVAGRLTGRPAHDRWYPRSAIADRPRPNLPMSKRAPGVSQASQCQYKSVTG
jgi:hypothetical protein